jgi:subtilisin family serine protease
MKTTNSIILSLSAALFALTAGAQPIPNDPMFSQQYALTKIGATNAWQVSTGSSNVVVAILSSGINYFHEDLSANMWRNPGEIPGNGIDDDANGYVDDVHGIDPRLDGDPMDEGIYYPTYGQFYHGTINAGVIGAVANNGVGIAGVNGSVRLMALRSLKPNSFASDIIAALDYISLMKDRGVNIRVVHLPYFISGAFVTQAMRQGHERVAARGILQVAVAQPADLNHDVSPAYPAAYRVPGMITVACSDQSDNLVAGTGYGRTSMDLVAPSLGVVTTSGQSPDSYTTYPDGTELGAAHVAGAAALLFAIAPAATAEDVKAALLETVDVFPSLADKVATSGRLNVGRAVRHPRIVSKALRFTSIKRLEGGATRVALEAPVPVQVTLETSADMIAWKPLTTLTFDRRTEFTDREATLGDQRFYRARLVSP